MKKCNEGNTNFQCTGLKSQTTSWELCYYTFNLKLIVWYVFHKDLLSAS